jgi:hypothetical protein
MENATEVLFDLCGDLGGENQAGALNRKGKMQT